ncbi:MAG: HTH domain-containing protein [Candidatus Woesearchaeota archaeon]
MNKTAQIIITLLLKDLSTHTVTTISKNIKISRQGIWKVLKQLEKEELIVLEQMGTGKTNLHRIKLNWDNVLLEKLLSLSLTQDALKQKRWRHNFASLENEVDFLILYGSILHSSKEANDIDVIGIAPKKNLSEINDLVLKVQETQAKKIHSINFTKQEFKQELRKRNKAFIDAIKKGIILFGQEKFVNFMRELQND